MIRKLALAVVGLVLVAASLGLAAAWAGGWKLTVVQTESMAPDVPRDSLVLVAPADPHGAERGDVIAFDTVVDGRRITILHRVVRVIDNQAGGRAYETRGDANAAPDPEFVPSRAVNGQMRWHAAHLGAVARHVKAPWTYVVLVGTPLLAFAASELRRWRGNRRRRRLVRRVSAFAAQA